MDKTTVSKIEAQGDRLMLTALVDQKGAILTDSGRRQLVRKICETNGPLLGAGATVHLDLFEKGQAKGSAFGSVTATSISASGITMTNSSPPTSSEEHTSELPSLTRTSSAAFF